MVGLELSLEGEERQIGLAVFLSASRALQDLLSAAAEVPVQWRVDDVRLGSLHLAIEAADRFDTAAEAVAVVQQGLSSLHKRAAIPDRFTSSMVGTAARLAGVVGVDGVTGASLSAGATLVRIDEVLAHNAEEALVGKSHSVGAVRGVLDTLNLRGRREVGLIDRTSARPLRCTFTEALHDDVIALMGHEVHARGRLARNSAGQKTRLELWSVQRVTREAAVPVRQLIGVLGSEWTGGLNSVDFVRNQRADEA